MRIADETSQGQNLGRRDLIKQLALVGATALGVSALTPSDALALTPAELEKPLTEVSGGEAENLGVGAAFPTIKPNVGKHEGFANLGIGCGALALTTGSYNIVIGDASGSAVKTGSANTILGVECAPKAELQYATIIGADSLRLATAKIEDITVFGVSAAEEVREGGSFTAIGSNALGNYKRAEANVAVGQEAMVGGGKNASGKPEATGKENVAVGLRAMRGPEKLSKAGEEVQSGSQNVAIGFQALEGLTAGTNNVAIGWLALVSVHAQSNNTAIGAVAGEEAEGEGNVFLGSETGPKVKGSGNVLLGAQAGNTLGSVNNRLVIANNYTTEPLIEGVFAGNFDEGTGGGTLKLNTTSLTLGKSGSTLSMYGGSATAAIGKNLTLKELKAEKKGVGFSTEAEMKKVIEFLEKFSEWAHSVGIA